MINEAYIHYYLLMLLVFSALITDHKTFRIKGWVSYPIIIAAVFINYYTYGVKGLYDSLGGIALPVAALFIFYLCGILRDGDIKFFSAIGALMGYNFIIGTIVYAFLVRGIITLIIWSINRNIAERVKYVLNHLKSCWTARTFLPYYSFDYQEERAKIPFSFAIVCGVLIKIITLP